MVIENLTPEFSRKPIAFSSQVSTGTVAKHGRQAASECIYCKAHDIWRITVGHVKVVLLVIVLNMRYFDINFKSNLLRLFVPKNEVRWYDGHVAHWKCSTLLGIDSRFYMPFLPFLHYQPVQWKMGPKPTPGPAFLQARGSTDYFLLKHAMMDIVGGYQDVMYLIYLSKDMCI